VTRSTRFTGSTRLARGAALGVAAVLITILGHAGGHGALPEAGLLVLLLPLAIALGALVTHKRRSGAWVLGFVLALQVLFHVLLTIIAGHGHDGALLPDTSMLLGHVVAAVAVAVVLTHGDALIHRWIGFWQALALELRWTPAPLPFACAPIFIEPHVVDSTVLGHAIARRGPPAS
jgi:hypothetical protein